MNQEQIITFKFDGKSDNLKNHQIDARLLASTLDSFADLISAADLALNDHDTGVQVKAKAGFVRGSFGIDFAVFADPTLIQAIGLTVAYATGSVLSVLKDLKGGKVESIEIDEGSKLAQILTSKGESIEVDVDVALIIKDKNVRDKIDKLIYQPLINEGIDTISIYPDADLTSQPVIEITDESMSYFKRPPAIETTEKTITETVASVEFLTANRDSGSSGWRMNYLSYEDVPVKITDESFLQRIRASDAPRIFAGKFEVNLTTDTVKQGDVVLRQTFKITRVVRLKKSK